jgi:hypothetical protein
MASMITKKADEKKFRIEKNLLQESAAPTMSSSLQLFVRRFTTSVASTSSATTSNGVPTFRLNTLRDNDGALQVVRVFVSKLSK